MSRFQLHVSLSGFELSVKSDWLHGSETVIIGCWHAFIKLHEKMSFVIVLIERPLAAEVKYFLNKVVLILWLAGSLLNTGHSSLRVETCHTGATLKTAWQHKATTKSMCSIGSCNDDFWWFQLFPTQALWWDTFEYKWRSASWQTLLSPCMYHLEVDVNCIHNLS